MVDLKTALQDPPAVFETPEAVVECQNLSQSQKVEILQRWEYDVRELEVATGEGMPGEKSGLLGRIRRILEKLGAASGTGQASPTRHGGA